MQNLSFTQQYEPVWCQCKLAVLSYSICIHVRANVCVCVCLKREGRAVHQISHLIWAASGEVKGAVGRLSSRRRGGKKKKGETESRWCECERG